MPEVLSHSNGKGLFRKGLHMFRIFQATTLFTATGEGP